MKSLIQRLIYDEKISNDCTEVIEEFSKKSRNVDYMKYKFGSNDVPAEIAMSTK